MSTLSQAIETTASAVKSSFPYSVMSFVDGSTVLIKKENDNPKTIKFLSPKKTVILKLPFDETLNLNSSKDLHINLNDRITKSGGKPLPSLIPSIDDCVRIIEEILTDFKGIFPGLIDHFNKPKEPEATSMLRASFLHHVKNVNDILQVSSTPSPESSNKRKREEDEIKIAEGYSKKLATSTEDPSDYQITADFHTDVFISPLLAFAERLFACQLILNNRQPTPSEANKQILVSILNKLLSLDPGRLSDQVSQFAKTGKIIDDNSIIQRSLFRAYRIALALRHHYSDTSLFSEHYKKLDSTNCKKSAEDFYKTLIAIEPTKTENLKSLIKISNLDQKRHLWFCMAAQFLANGDFLNFSDSFQQLSNGSAPLAWSEHILGLAYDYQTNRNNYKINLEKAAVDCPNEKIKVLKLQFQLQHEEQNFNNQESIMTQIIDEYQKKPKKSKQLFDWRKKLLERYEQDQALPIKVIGLIEKMVDFPAYPENAGLLDKLRDLYHFQSLETTTGPFLEKLGQVCDRLINIYKQQGDKKEEDRIVNWTVNKCPTPSLLRVVANSSLARGDINNYLKNSVSAALLEESFAGHLAINTTIDEFMTRSTKELDALPIRLPSSLPIDDENEQNRNPQQNEISEQIIQIIRIQQASLALLSREMKLIANAVASSLPVEAVETIEAPFLKETSAVFGKAEWRALLPDVDTGKEPPLPRDLEQIWNTQCPYFKGKTIKETHILFWMPGQLNGQEWGLQYFREILALKKRSFAYSNLILGDSPYISSANQFVPKSQWILLTQNIVPETRGQSYIQQLHLVRSQKGYDIPTVLELSIANFMTYNQYGELLYGSSPITYSRCTEKLYEIPWLVGNYHLTNGLQLKLNPPTDTGDHRRVRQIKNQNDIGMAAARRFEI